MRIGSRDGGPDEIENESHEHDQERSDREDSQRPGRRFGGPCQQAFYSAHQIGSGGILRDPAPGLVHVFLRGSRLGSAGGQDERRHAEVRAIATP